MMNGRLVAVDTVVVVAASAGGITALQHVLADLPATFSGALVIVQHRAPTRASVLDQILQRVTPLPVVPIRGGERLAAGTIYLAPPDRHVVVTANGVLGLHDGTRVRHVRSSANPLFESAAKVFGPKVIAVVLTGGGTDATDGVQTIRAHGGIVIVQDEASSAVFGMPRSAIATGAASYVVPLHAIGRLLRELTGAQPISQ